MDYNIEPGAGTELAADSIGEGLLEHERAYLRWLDGVFERYPDLVIENCSSGGLRIDYALLSRYSIQSTSDQEDYRNYATIAANAITGVTPEQAAVWSYPMKNGDKEEVIYNMINSMLLRIHQSGHLAELSEERRALVKEGIACYKRIRNDVKIALPFWPKGLADNKDVWLCSGIKTDNKAYLAVWKRYAKEDVFEINLEKSLCAEGKSIKQVRCIYPVSEETEFVYDMEKMKLTVTFSKQVMARLFEIIIE